MPLLPMRSSWNASAVMPPGETAATNRDLSDETDDTANCGQTLAPLPSSLIACMVPDPKLGWSTQKVRAPVPLGRVVTKICESEPSGTITRPLDPHCGAPAGSNFCP